MRCLTLFFLLITLKSFSQEIKSQDSLVNLLVERQKSINAKKLSMPGYRIQLYFGPERGKANHYKSDFLQEYPDVGAYVIYQQPNFKLRIGDFKTKLEAKKFLAEVQTRFAVAFIVNDEVKLPSPE
jgi:hypothetical protein